MMSSSKSAKLLSRVRKVMSAGETMCMYISVFNLSFQETGHLSDLVHIIFPGSAYCFRLFL